MGGDKMETREELIEEIKELIEELDENEIEVFDEFIKKLKKESYITKQQ